MQDEHNEREGDIYDKLMGAQLCVISAIVVILAGAYFGGMLLAYLGV
jgi:hypothetical protein